MIYETTHWPSFTSYLTHFIKHCTQIRSHSFSIMYVLLTILASITLFVYIYIYHGVIQVCLQSITLVYPATLPWGSCTGLLLASTSTNEVCPFTVTWFRNNICGTPTAGVIWALVLTWGEPCTIRLLGCCTMFEVCTIWPAPDAMGVACETLVKFCKLDRVPSAT